MWKKKVTASELEQLKKEYQSTTSAYIAEVENKPRFNMKEFDLKKYRLADDGSILMAANPPQLVRAIRDSSRFASHEDIFEYMEGFAERYRIETGNSVRCDGSNNFVEDLLKFGFLEEIPSE